MEFITKSNLYYYFVLDYFQNRIYYSYNFKIIYSYLSVKVFLGYKSFTNQYFNVVTLVYQTFSSGLFLMSLKISLTS